MFNKASGIFITGLLAGASYLPLTLQMLLGAGYLEQTTQTITFYFFPMCWAVLGLGFVIPRRYPAPMFPIVTAVLLFSFLILSLAMPLNVDSQSQLAARILVCWIPAGLLYFVFGQELNSYLSLPDARVHYLYGFFLVALTAGGIFSDQAAPLLGGNALLVFLGLAILSAKYSFKISSPLMIAVAATLNFAQADTKIERLRNVGLLADFKDPDLKKKKWRNESSSHLENYSQAFDKIAWNRRGMTFMYRDEGSESYLGVVNIHAEHKLPFVSEKNGRKIHNSLINKDKDILYVGAGSGRSVWAMPPALADKNIWAVERDRNTVHLMLENGFNPNLSRVNFVDYDGRAFIEQSEKKWDWIVIESSLRQRNTSPFQLFQPYNLYTAEAVRSYWDRLKEGGTLLIEISRPNEPSRRSVAGAVIQSMESIMDPSVQRLYVLKDPLSEVGPLLIHIRKGGAPLTLESLRIEASAKIEHAADFPFRPCVRSYSDHSPFLDWMCMPPHRRAQIFFYTSWLLIILGAGFFVKERFISSRSAGLTELNSIFILQSAAHCFLFLGISYLLRSSFQDEIGTFYVFTYSTTLIASMASFYVDHRLGKGRVVHFFPTAVAMILSLLWLLLFAGLDIPSLNNVFARFSLMTAAVFPFYFFSSLIFHVNLQRAVKIAGGVRQAFLFDSLALVPAYLIVPWILFELGIPALLAVAALTYFAMIAIMWIQRGASASAQSPSP